MSFRSHPLIVDALFQDLSIPETFENRVKRSYARAIAVARVYNISARDVLELSDRFLDLHKDLVWGIDGAAATLVSIQYNLAAGTLAPFVKENPSLKSLLDDILHFRVLGQFLLTEVAHGLDALHLETTATLLPSGEFDLHTPNPGAAKFMPSTSPWCGIPNVSLVFARLIVGGEFRGIRAFVVPTADGKGMCGGVSTRILPQRSGSNAIDHGITYFNHVKLPPTSILGDLAKPKDVRLDFFSRIWRVSVGGICLSSLAIPAMSTGLYIAGRYSLRRHIMNGEGIPTPIISFRTQQLPILHGLAQVEVMKSFEKHAVKVFKDQSLNIQVRKGISVVYKAVINQHCQETLYELVERCGAQGLYEYNQIITVLSEMRGVCIAEGDVLVLCIRLCSELLQGKYHFPEAVDPSCMLAKHEAGIFSETQALMRAFGKKHRSENFNAYILPRSKSMIQAIGHRMAYEAAITSGVDPRLVSLYESHIIALDPGWYAETDCLSRSGQLEKEVRAVNDVLPLLEDLLQNTGVEDYTSAPIVSDLLWKRFEDSLPLLVHQGRQKSESNTQSSALMAKL